MISVLDNKLEDYKFTVKAINVCLSNNLVRVKDILEYYKNNKTFLKFRGCASKINAELTEFCENIINKNKFNYYKTQSYQTKNQETNETKKFDKINYLLNSELVKNDVLIEYIKTRMNQQSGRLRNVLKSLFFNTNNNLEKFFLNIKQFIDNKARNMKGVGEATIIEVERFVSEIWEFSTSIKYKEKKWDNSFSKIKKLINVSTGIKSDIFNKYETSFNNKNLKLFKLLDIIIINYILDDRENFIFSHLYGYYNYEGKTTLRKISLDLGLSHERVRQLSEEINIKIIKNLSIFSFLAKIFFNHTKYQINTDNDYILLTESFAKKVNNEEKLNFTFNYFCFLLQILVINTHQLLISNKKNIKNQFYIKNELWKQFDFADFYQDLQVRTRIVKKSYTMFFDDYFRFFSKKDSIEQSNSVRIMIGLIVNKEFNLNVDSDYNIYIEKTTKKTLHEYMIDILEKNERPMHISEIEKQMRLIFPHLKFTRSSISSTANTVEEIVCYGKKSTYGLKIWGDCYGTSLKDMVEYILKTNKRPMHSTELSKELKKYTKCSEKSIRSNLKIDHPQRFRFFDGSFIGLKNVKYKKSEINFQKMRRIPIIKIKFLLNDLSYPINYLKIIGILNRKFKFNSLQSKIILERFIRDGFIKITKDNYCNYMKI